MRTLKVGDTVIRKSESDYRAPTRGVIERIWTPTRSTRPRPRAEVRWLGANRRRLGAKSPDKRGRILLDALIHVEDVASADTP